MSFNSLNFLFIFFPLLIFIYIISDIKYRNLILIISSLLFYSWGQLQNLPLIIAIILVNFILGKEIDKNLKLVGMKAKYFLLTGCVINLSILIFFKAFSGYGNTWSFLPSNLLKELTENQVPLGLSYISFQVISYLIDIYKNRCNCEKNILNFSLYILLFPKIILGPIVRYRDIVEQLSQRKIDSIQLINGLRRFVVGLSKKVLIADTIAQTINPAFSLNTPNFSTEIAWFVLFGYAVQLYFDFSGFSDIAIGIGQILGFKFFENFNYPYISKSITEFWRRWHISLSSWFRDYVFYPLEHERHNSRLITQKSNILFVFILTGLWHGLTINYIIWGAIHGLALVFEMRFIKNIKKCWIPFQHSYTLIVVLFSWVFFRARSLNYAIQFIFRLFGSQQGISPIPFSVTQPLPIINNTVWIALVAGFIFSIPILPSLRGKWNQVTDGNHILQAMGQVGSDAIVFFLGILSIASITSMGVVGNIYGGF